jgi:Tol biopolymer transport system component
MLVAGIGVGGFVLFRGIGLEISVPYSPTRGDSDPTWSPDGTRIAFTRIGKEDAGHIYVVDFDGSKLRKLTHANEKNESPVWSPDGNRIAFANVYGLTITDADGGNPRFFEYGAGGDWSSDGRWIAFDRGDGIDVAGVADVKARRLVRRGEGPAWSPDGTSMAFTRRVVNHSRIFVIRANGTAVRHLSDASDYTATAWSPDGTTIAFTRRAANGYRIFIIRANGTGVRQLTDASGWDDGYPLFAWSPDGRRIAFDRNHGIYIVRVADGKTRRLVRGGSHWAWSPDGRAIAFMHRRNIYTVGVDSLRVRRLAISLPADFAAPVAHRIEPDEFAWSPDSREVAFSAYGRLFVVRETGGRARQLTDGGF